MAGGKFQTILAIVSIALIIAPAFVSTVSLALDHEPYTTDEEPYRKYVYSFSVYNSYFSNESRPLGPDVSVAPRYSNSPLTVLDDVEFTVEFTRNVKVTRESGSSVFGFEHEPSIAVDPGNNANVVVAAHHEGVEDLFVAIGAYYSMDSGETWNGPVFLETAYPGDVAHSDPALASTGDGTFYIGYLSIGYRQLESGARIFSSSVMVAKSADGGASWSTVLVVDPDYIVKELEDSGIYVFDVLLDKPYIDARKVGDLEIVVITYTEVASIYDSNTGKFALFFRIVALVSTDGGETWIGPSEVARAVSDIGNRFSPDQLIRVIQGSNPHVAADGTIYVAYYDSLEDGFLTGRAAIMVSSSQDLGSTWSEPEVAAILEREMEHRAPAGFRMSASMFPSLGSSPDGTLYVAYASATNGGDPGEVFLVYRDPGNGEWSLPIKVSPSPEGSLQFFPWLDVDEDGKVHIIWGDTLADPLGITYRVLYASFDKETGTFEYGLVSDYASMALFVGFIGDYFNLAASQGQVYVVWTDLRMSLKRVGPLFFAGADTSIFLAKIGDRPEPTVTLSYGPGEFVAGRSEVVEVTLENFPAYAAFRVTLGGVDISQGTSGLIFTDENGSAVQSVILPPLSEGSYTLAIESFTDGSVTGTLELTYRDAIASGIQSTINEVRDLREDIAGINKTFEGEFTALKDRLSSIESVLQGHGEQLTNISTGIEDLGSGVSMISNKLDANMIVISSSLDDVRKEVIAQGELTREEVSKNSEVIVSEVSKSASELKTSIDGLKTFIEEAVSQIGVQIDETRDRANMGIALSSIALVGALAAAGVVLRRMVA